MTSALKTSLTDSIEIAAKTAGLVVLSATEGKDFHGAPTAVFELGLPSGTAIERALKLELSEQFDFNKPELLPTITQHLAEETKRLRNPVPSAYVTLEGLPVSLKSFAWPFHRSTSGADTYIVHGEIRLEDGTNSPLHAKISAAMTVTFADIVPAAEQPFAETFIYNAIRKTLDQGQLELVKSGNRQPVPVTTRYYSLWKKRFMFTDSDETTRLDFVLLKTYWLSGVLGASQPVWIADSRDAQYLNTTEAELLAAAKIAEANGLITLDGEFAAATPALLAKADTYRARLDTALALTKPEFNESMRSGHANM